MNQKERQGLLTSEHLNGRELDELRVTGPTLCAYDTRINTYEGHTESHGQQFFVK